MVDRKFSVVRSMPLIDMLIRKNLQSGSVVV